MKKNITNSQLENEEFLTSQIITYLGNKRALLDFIGESVLIVKEKLKKEKLEIVDIFSGSGIVSRYFKQHSERIITNDLEDYAYTLNKCYLSNKNEIKQNEIVYWYEYIVSKAKKNINKGIISKNYAPENNEKIKYGERCFYTKENAIFIDTIRKIINEIPEKYQCYFIAPLLTEASVKNNTSGVFKGFYKNSQTGIGQFGGNNENALSRIKSNITLPFPIFSNFNCKVEIHKEDANNLVKKLDVVDLIYMDPPYNQHPYGSNYFMLNIINNYEMPKQISKVSGIPKNWNRSKYNQIKEAKKSFKELCENAKARFILISFSSDGFIQKKEMLEILSKIGKVKIMEKKYNTYRGSRNLKSRKLYIKEYLYLVEIYKYMKEN